MDIINESGLRQLSKQEIEWYNIYALGQANKLAAQLRQASVE